MDDVDGRSSGRIGITGSISLSLLSCEVDGDNVLEVDGVVHGSSRQKSSSVRSGDLEGDSGLEVKSVLSSGINSDVGKVSIFKASLAFFQHA